jgi:uroporphyrinogen-III synthase
MNVLLTRPLTQVKPLKSLVIDSGHQALLFPTLEVKSIFAKVRRTQYDAIIFISANAVEYGLAILKTLKYSAIFTVGGATAKKLNSYGIAVDDFPRQNASSEALLNLSSIAKITAKNILIFRGKGGRETLKIGLEKNANQVEYVEVYERIICKLSNSHRQILDVFLSAYGVVSITSYENLDGLILLAKQLKQLKKLKTYPIIALSQRIQKYALSQGFTKVLVADDISNQAIVKAVENIDIIK